MLPKSFLSNFWGALQFYYSGGVLFIVTQHYLLFYMPQGLFAHFH